MCKHGTTKLIPKNKLMYKYNRYGLSEQWIHHHGGIPVDFCISDEVEWLITTGVITLSCCCSHFKGIPKCLVHNDSVELVRQLGYNTMPYRHDEGFTSYEIILLH